MLQARRIDQVDQLDVYFLSNGNGSAFENRTKAGLPLTKVSFGRCLNCPLVWSRAAEGHLRRLDKVQKRALSLLGLVTIVDSLVLRRTALSVASASYTSC